MNKIDLFVKANDISIPSGAIKRVVKDNARVYGSAISIPSGAIKSSDYYSYDKVRV